MKALLTMLAIAGSLWAPQVFAKTIYDTGDYPTSGWENPVGWGDIDGFGGFGDGNTGMGAAAEAELPGVTVICRRSALSTVCPTGLTGVDVINMPGAPQLDLGAGGGDGDTQTPEQKQKCIDGCMVANTIATGNCTIASDKLRKQLMADATNAGTIGFLFRIFRGSKKFSPDPDQVNTAYGIVGAEIERKIAEFNSDCAANVATSTNKCLQGKCHAYFALPLLIVPAFRRKRQQETTTA